MNHTVLGHDIVAGQKVQYVQKPWTWFGAYPTKDVVHVADDSVVKAPARDSEKHYSLVGTTVAPAFEVADFELANRDDLVAHFPHAKAIIEYLTYP